MVKLTNEREITLKLLGKKTVIKTCFNKHNKTSINIYLVAALPEVLVFTHYLFNKFKFAVNCP